MIDQLKKNIETEIDILREIAQYNLLLKTASQPEQRLLMTSITSLQSSMKLVNNSIPEILSTISLAKKLSPESKEMPLEKVSFKGDYSNRDVILLKEDKSRFFKELSITEDSLKRVKKKIGKHSEQDHEFQGSRGYIKISNLLFMNTATHLIRRGYFRPLALDIRKANLDMILESYVSMMFFTTILSFLGALLLTITFLFVTSVDSTLTTMLKFMWIPFVVPIATLILLYFYPASEKGSLEKKIDQELPFAVIHMSAISGSGIEPSNIFKIIATSKEYPYLRKELRKVINQINLYGYDLVTALTLISHTTPSSRLSELFSGLSTTINSGGDLSEFFEKRADTLLVGYRLEREKFTRVAETFMDIYITVAIAAPMILLLVLIILSLSNFDLGFSPGMMTFLIIIFLGLVNVAFLSILNVKQPAY